MGLFKNITGIIGSLFQFGNGAGPILKDNSGVIEIRDSDDAAYARVKAGSPVDVDDLVTKSYGDANYTAGSGDVVGPGSATDEAVARFDGVTGKLVQNSSVLVDDTGNLRIPAVGQYRFDTGPLLKNVSGVVEARTNGDAGYAIVRGATPVGNNDFATKFYADTTFAAGTLQTAKDDTESSTGSTTPVQKLRLTTTSLIAGTYVINWYCEVANGNKQNETFVRVELDDTTLLTEIAQDFNEALQYKQVSGFDTQVLSGVHTIDIDWWTTANTAYIRRARLILWRISD